MSIDLKEVKEKYQKRVLEREETLEMRVSLESSWNTREARVIITERRAREELRDLESLSGC